MGGRRAPGGMLTQASARIGLPTWTRKDGAGRRPAIRRTLVSMRTPFPKSPDAAGVTISTLLPEPCSRSRSALFSIAHAWSYRSRSGRTASTRCSAVSTSTMGRPWRTDATARLYPLPGPRSTSSPCAPLRSMCTTILRMRISHDPQPHLCGPESVNAILTRRYRGNCGQVMRNTVNGRVQASRDLPEDEWGLMSCFLPNLL